MKKKFRKMVSVLVATMMVLAMGMISVNASDIQPRAPLCPSCGSSMIPKVTYGSWSSPKSVSCIHGFPYGDDKLYTRNVTTKVTCTNKNCLLAYPGTTKTETKRECFGHY